MRDGPLAHELLGSRFFRLRGWWTTLPRGFKRSCSFGSRVFRLRGWWTALPRGLQSRSQRLAVSSFLKRAFRMPIWQRVAHCKIQFWLQNLRSLGPTWKSHCDSRATSQRLAVRFPLALRSCVRGGSVHAAEKKVPLLEHRGPLHH